MVLKHAVKTLCTTTLKLIVSSFFNFQTRYKHLKNNAIYPTDELNIVNAHNELGSLAVQLQ